MLNPGFLDGREIQIPCPKCGGKTKKSIAWIKNNTKYTCPCGVVVSFNADKLVRQVTEFETAKLSALTAHRNTLKAATKKFNKR